jgi:hypothetical protein
MGVFGSSSTNQPDPGNFQIQRITSHFGHPYCVVIVHYPNCTNCDGRKILVFNKEPEEVESMKWMDPHFSESDNSPIARFAPTLQGWINAIDFIEMITRPNNERL